MKVLYAVVRSDLASMPVGGGKAMAQAMHAANRFMWMAAGGFDSSRPPYSNKAFVEWCSESLGDQVGDADGFGTTITLQIDSLKRLEGIVSSAERLGFSAGLVVDKEYPYEVSPEILSLLPESLHTAPAVRLANGNHLCFRRETTCGYVFGEKADLALVMRQFHLVPNDPAAR